jgi:ABC-type multidrug transport system fused ATPase/permease subunit
MRPTLQTLPGNGKTGGWETHPQKRRVLARLIRMVWGYRWRCLLVLFLQIALLILGMTGLTMAGMGVDVIRYEIESRSAPPKWPLGLQPPAGMHGMSLLFLFGGSILLLAVVRGVLNYFYDVCVARLVEGEIVVHLRNELYEKVQRMDFRFFDSNSSSSIINRITGDVQSVRLVVDGVIIPAAIMLLSLSVYVVYMLSIHTALTLACLAPMPLIWLLSLELSRRVHPKYVVNRKLFDDLVLWFSECVKGILVIKAFAFEQRAVERFEEKNRTFRQQQRSIFETTSIFIPTIDGVTHLSMAILLGYGGWLVMHDRVSLGAGLIVFAGLLQQFSGQISKIGSITNSVQQSLAAAERVFEILDARPAIQSAPTAKWLNHPRGQITFESVSFAYQRGGSVLQGVSFTIEPGQCVGIVGPTASGKSALLSLIPRFYDPEKGCIKVDGHDVRSLDIESLRSCVGVVFQESFLFAATVAENIAFGRPRADREKIQHAARLAAADEFIRNLPKGYDTELREGGTSLSGGQRQRLALARSLLHDPRILLLDDPTAAVDSHTEREILDALDQAVAGRTVLLVTHRIAALRRTDWVIALEGGSIVQQGKPHELARMPGYYRTLAAIQCEDNEET